jgi:hypothetical protein
MKLGQCFDCVLTKECDDPRGDKAHWNFEAKPLPDKEVKDNK